jgi:membrane fusion protein (multidrug efflux system)
MTEKSLTLPSGRCATAVTPALRSERLFTAAALTLVLAVAGGCDHKAAAPPAPPPLPVNTLQVQATDVPIDNEWIGTLDGNVNAQIQPQVSGYLIRQSYKEGSLVHKGQVLFEIDPRPFQATLDQTQAQLAQARAAYALTQVNINRDAPLADMHAIATSQLDNDKAQGAQADANVKAVEATVATAKLNLGFTHVRSLITGVSGQATTQVGNLVTPQSVLTSVSQLDPIRVYFSLSDAQYLALTNRARDGQGSLLSHAADLPLTLQLGDNETYPHKGRIVFVDRQMNAQTGAIRIAAVFPNPGNVLRPGEFARIRAYTTVQHNVILVPQSAIQELQGLEQAYTLTPDHKVHVVNVKLGPQVGSDWIVESGLPTGSTIIVNNLQKLAEGEPVDPHAAPVAPPAVPAAADADMAGADTAGTR